MVFSSSVLQKKQKTLRTMILYRVFATKKTRTQWVHPLNEARPWSGEHLKIDRMYREFPDKFFQYTRMSPQLFDKLLAMIEPDIKKKHTNWRETIPPRVRLYVTLR